MARLTPAAFAGWVFQHLELDVWLTEATLQRRLAGVSKCPFTAPALLGALRRAGWAEAHPLHPQEYCLASRCWWPAEKPKSLPDATREASHSIAHS